MTDIQHHNENRDHITDWQVAVTDDNPDQAQYILKRVDQDQLIELLDLFIKGYQTNGKLQTKVASVIHGSARTRKQLGKMLKERNLVHTGLLSLVIDHRLFAVLKLALEDQDISLGDRYARAIGFMQDLLRLKYPYPIPYTTLAMLEDLCHDMADDSCDAEELLLPKLIQQYQTKVWST